MIRNENVEDGSVVSADIIDLVAGTVSREVNGTVVWTRPFTAEELNRYGPQPLDIKGPYGDEGLSSAVNGEVLAYDGVNWENRQESWAAFKRSAWWLFHSTAQLTGTHVVGFRAAHPFYIPSSGMNCDAIGLRVRLDSPGAILRLGLYASDPSTGYPTDLIVDAGTVDCSTAGNKAATFTAVDLPPGLVWIAQHCTGANISGYVFTHTSSVRPGFPMPQSSLNPGTSWLNSLLMGANELVDEPLSSVYPSGQAQTRFANSCHLRYA